MDRPPVFDKLMPTECRRLIAAGGIGRIAFGTVCGPVPLAQWRAPDGQLRTGPVCAPSGAAAGSRVTVWVNGADELTDPPMRQREIADRTELAQGLAVGFAVALAAIGGLARKSLDQRTAA
jgi:hypothetical protein